MIDAFAFLGERGIEPILIKGLAAAALYPDPTMRVSSDADLAVSAVDYPAAEALQPELASSKLTVDLHCELRHLDTVPWDDLLSNTRTMEIDGVSIRVLRPEDHLRVLIVHWLTDGGSERHRLWDVYYGIANRSTNFDWSRFLDLVSDNRRRWLVCTIGLARHFLDLDLTGTPVEQEASELPAWLIRAVEREWAAGTAHMPMEAAILRPGKIASQVRKRLRPNPIWATVQMEGSFDARTRVFYQTANFFKRITPSFRRIGSTFKNLR